MGKQKYTTQTMKEALKLLADPKANLKEISELTGINIGTIVNWISDLRYPDNKGSLMITRLANEMGLKFTPINPSAHVYHPPKEKKGTGKYSPKSQIVKEVFEGKGIPVQEIHLDHNTDLRGVPIQLQNGLLTRTVRFSMDDFIEGLERMLTDYKKLKREREAFQIEVKQLQKLLGKMNDDVQSLARDR
jgi:hypothetical protein